MTACGSVLIHFILLASLFSHPIIAQVEILDEEFGNWAQYSPFIPVESDINPAIPDDCNVTFIQGLYRHGARFPTESKGKTYSDLIAKIQASGQAPLGKLSFVKTFKYSLGTEELTVFGRQELNQSGENFFNRYARLAIAKSPFMRTTGVSRVVDSSRAFIDGYNRAKQLKYCVGPTERGPEVYDYAKDQGDVKNALSHGGCKAFENTYKDTQKKVQEAFASTFLPGIASRVQKMLPGVDISEDDAADIMALCPFVSVAQNPPTLSDFCAAFEQSDWDNYGYYETLGKYYAFGPGNDLGPTQGVGFVQELIARLINQPVEDRPFLDYKVDSDPKTFPRRPVYVDFSHDNEMLSIMSALELFQGLPILPTDRKLSPKDAGGFWMAWLVPFAARMFIERMDCGSEKNLVRVLVNDRVMPLSFCGANGRGQCTLQKFVGGLTFARSGGKWDEC